MREQDKHDRDRVPVVDDLIGRFERFVADTEPRLHRALVAAYGSAAGREAAAESLAWAWEHFDRVERMRNPGGYLYRVGQTAAKKGRRFSDRTELRVVEAANEETWPVEPALSAALSGLTPAQRTAVLLLDGWGHTLKEAATAMGSSISTVRVHHRRGLAKLRDELGVER